MPSTVRLRPSVLAAREQVQSSLQEVRRLHESGLASVQVCSRLSAAVDAVVTSLFEAALAELPDGGQKLAARLALIAIGGYGRRQQAPYSDVDLMVLYTGPLDDQVRSFTQRITQDLFDAGLKPGHSLRTPAEAIKLARGDTVICTSLIESRRLVGSIKTFEEFEQAFKQMVEKRSKAFCREFIEARTDERKKYGETVFLLEPNVKRSPGGLRDIHLLRWLWFARFGDSEPNRLKLRGVISNFDHRRLMSSQSFLLHIRNEMHFAAGTGNDVLDRAEQKRIAEAFHIRARQGLLPVEQLMRDYFRHSSHVSFLSTRLSDLSSPPPTVSRMLEPVLSQSLSAEFRLSPREIFATQVGVAKLKTSLADAVRLVDFARLYDKRIAQETWYHMYRAAPGYAVELDHLTVSRFMGMLSSPLNLGDALRRMHELGLLEKLIPDYTHARCLLQFNRYHKYTVDEHCIRAVGEATRLGERDDQVGDVYRRLKRKWLLHLTLLLHDLGKGKEGDHSILGADIARRVGPRLGLDATATELSAKLILLHLEMVHAALWHDTTDPVHVQQFADKLEVEGVNSVELLDMLFVHSCADLAAVGPGVLNNWKVGVLSDLYRRTKALLSDEVEDETKSRRAAAREKVWGELTADERENLWFQQCFRALPESFLTSHTPQELARTLRMLHDLPARAGTVTGRYVPDSQTVEFTAGVSQGVGRGVFSGMAGVLSSMGMSILAAETSVLKNDLLLLRYQAIDNQSEGPTQRGRLDEVAAAMTQSIDSTKAPVFSPIWGSAQSDSKESLAELPVEVRLNDQLSEVHLIIEIFAYDRLGLLYDLAHAVHNLGLNIRFAKIGTHLDQVVDVFYVTERDGAKPAGPDRLQEITARLTGIIDP